MERRWCASKPFGAEALKDWVLFHHPFQSAPVRKRFVALLDKALSAAAA
jgi:hypothetical protein